MAAMAVQVSSSAAPAPAASWSALEWAQFPPLYTLQPVAETRRQQLKVWVELVHDWARRAESFTFAPRSCPVFTNGALNRRLDDGGVDEVVAALVADGRAEALEDGRVFLLSERPAALAAKILAWATETGMLGSVYTVRELRDPKAAAAGSPCRGADARLLDLALSALENEDRCQVFSGATSADAGVKFFAKDR